MGLGFVADDAARFFSAHVDGDRHAVADFVLRDGAHQLHFLVQALHRLVARQRIAAADADLGQSRAFAHEHAESARRNLRIQRALVTFAHAIELGAVVGDEAREDVEPSGRAFRIAQRRGAALERQMLEQRHDVDAAALEHRAVGDVHLVHRQLFEPLLHRRAFPGQEARAHAVGDRSQSQVEACRLKLLLLDRLERGDFLGDLDLILELLRGEYSRRERARFSLVADLLAQRRGAHAADRRGSTGHRSRSRIRGSAVSAWHPVANLRKSG